MAKDDDQQDELGITRPDQAEWAWIKPHALRDAVILVDPSLKLEAVAEVLSANQSTQVQAWIAAGKLGKPQVSDFQAWEQDPARKFWCLVVKPFVLVQRLDS